MNMNDSVKIKNLSTKNRLVMPPLATNASVDNKVSPELIKFYTDRCSSGHIGLVITEHCYVQRCGIASARQLAIDSDSCIDSLSRLTESIKESGSLVFAQLAHAGAKSAYEASGQTPVSSSARNCMKYFGARARELSRDEISGLVEAFTLAALRAKKAGYDGVELHSAHGYLLNQFYSPLINCRDDEYGADCLENRLRLHTDIIKAIRSELGESFPIAVRFGGCDYTEGGSSIEEGAEGALILQNAGADLIDISGGVRGPSFPAGRAATFSDMSSAARKLLSVPVNLTGGIKTGAEAQALINQGAADLIGIGRALIANPRWAEEELK